MKLFTSIAISVFAVTATAAVAVASPTVKAHTAAIHCPVTGALIASPKAAYNSEVYKGKTYYFCCAGCKPMFDKNPAKYIKAATKS